MAQYLPQKTIHGDFKHSQLCEFGRDHWKLIDLDASVEISSKPLVTLDVAFTIIFAAPEVLK